MTAAARKFDEVDLGTAADELPPGTTLLFGQFTIESFLNSGGFGIVYLARDSLDRKVVIKECFPSTFCRRIEKAVGARSRAQQDEFRTAVRGFLQEAVTLSQLHHPNIVKVHHVFEDNDTAYMAMDYIDGPDLLQTVEGSARPLTPKQIVVFLDRMLDALGHVHAQGLLHRDISPDNMLVDKETGEPILIDFGASRKEVTRKSRAVSGLRVVKDGYSPQEFYVSGSKQAPCSDLYALAASFYHLISGEVPKTSQERLSAIAGREGDPLRPLAGRFRAYPRGFLQAIDKAMSIFPRDRLQSVAEWRAMLGEDTTSPAIAPVIPGVPSRTPAPTPAVAQAAAAASAPATTVLPTVQPIAAGARNLLVVSAAAVLLLVGLLSLPSSLRSTTAQGMEPVATTGTSSAEKLLVTNMLRLPGGLAFEMTDTPTGTETIVTAVPEGMGNTVAAGDVLLVYSPSGETLGTGTALRDILTREFEKGVTTYSFVIRRGASTMDAEFRLEVAG
ncbi:serine/threonine-protein kinase [Tabrizicola sp.]|jgi:serine/threonine protein kinase|uniref:serine/threonine protein kinase n=1 Tax=Tabrizicola sp. TaxID=2005166 RepID=UPI001A56F3E0|nr:serine/threonine-protein kinase [Tabrizicola sp.]MBL9061841.1 serine/threonine protein kinase [Tabrizicola sp.]